MSRETVVHGKRTGADVSRLNGLEIWFDPAATGINATNHDGVLRELKAEVVANKVISDAGSAQVEYYIPVGDESTDLTVATGKAELRAPIAFVLDSITISVTGAPTTTAIVVDINKNGTTMLTEKLHVNVTDKTSVGNVGVVAVGTVQITAGTGGECSSLTVNGVDLLSAAVPFNGTIDQTATDIAANITANTSVPDYNAVAVTDTITITKVGVGSDVNGDVPTPTWTSDLASTDVAMGGVAAYGLGLYSNYTIDPTAGVDTFAANDIITVDIDQIGNGAAGKGLKVWLFGTRV